jgi:sucrose phosphorylase
LPQTHRVIQLMRSVLDLVAPHVALITETNVPHEENIAYFGDGHNEAQMVYNFSLPPLTLHAFHIGDARTLSRWAAGLTLPSDQVTFFNFLASHDGIGLTPARDILSDEQVEAMAQRAQAAGGLVSYRSLGDGRQVAYELNVNYLDALAEPGVVESDDLRARRFLASQAVMLALRGVPGIYFHSLFGSHGWPEGVEQTGRARTINRQKLALSQLEQELSGGLRKQIFDGYSRLLRTRAAAIAFHPNGEQEVLDLHPAVFALVRRHEGQAVLCLQNVSNRRCNLVLPWAGATDLLSGSPLSGHQASLAPYEILWLKES